MSRIPRPYQLAAVDSVKKLWRQGKRSVVVAMAVGSGKTYTAELLIVPILTAEWAQVVFLSNRETLLDQPALRFADLRIRHAFVKAGRDADVDAPIQFCSAPTLARRQFTPARKSDGTLYKRVFVVVDECHSVKSATFIAILNHLHQVFEYVYVLGLSASPYRLDGRGLGDVFEELIEGTTPQQLMADGVLLRPVYFTQPPPVAAEGEDADAALQRPGIVGDVVGTWEKRARGLPTICRAFSIAHSRVLVERFRQAGIRAAHIDGTMSTAQRRRLLCGLAIGGAGSTHPLALDVLSAGSNIFDEGFDSRASYEMLLPRGDGLEAWRLLRCPDVELDAAATLSLRRRVLAGVLPELRDFWPAEDSDVPMEPPTYRPLCVLIDAAPTASCGAWMQRQGRVVRSWSGDGDDEIAVRQRLGLSASSPKTLAIILCHSGNLERHGPLLLHDAEHCDGFKLAADAAWSPKLAKSQGVAKLSVRMPATCPGCLCVDVAGTETCRYCGTAMTTPKLPDEQVEIELVERAAESVAASTPGTRESYLRARYREMKAVNKQRAAQGKPPYKDKWPAVRFKSRFGFWPPHGLDQQIRREMGFG